VQPQLVHVHALAELAAAAQGLGRRLAVLQRDVDRRESGAGRRGERDPEVDVVLLRPGGRAAQRGEGVHQREGVRLVDRILRRRRQLADLVAARSGRGAERERSVRLVETHADPEGAGAVGGAIRVTRGAGIARCTVTKNGRKPGVPTVLIVPGGTSESVARTVEPRIDRPAVTRLATTLDTMDTVTSGGGSVDGVAPPALTVRAKNAFVDGLAGTAAFWIGL